MPLIPFPNIPVLPGVPSLPRSPSFPPAANVVLGAIQGALWRAVGMDTRWGIYDQDGNSLGGIENISGMIESFGIGPTLSTNSVEYSKETRVSDFPVEQGGFASYNKVELPASPVVILCLSGSESDRSKFLDGIDQAVKSTNLYSIVTPEVTYIDYSVERYNYSRRNSKGANLLIVEIELKEIRQVSSQYTQSNKGPVDNPKDIGATPSVDNGKVQPKTPDVSTLKKIGEMVGF